jgi:RNA polymerase sigma-70 factor (ECF subfamily)
VFTLNPELVEAETSESPALLAQAQQGDSDSFCQLCRIHGNRLLRHATGLCSDPSLAEDLAQETLFEAWKSIRRYNGQCRFFTWLCAILVNRHRNFLRQKRPVALTVLAPTEREGAQSILEQLPDGAARPDQATSLAERATLLRGCIDRLPPKHRQVIYLRFYVDDSLEGIALALGCSVGTVKSRLFYAIEQLREMKGRGFDELRLDGRTP